MQSKAEYFDLMIAILRWVNLGDSKPQTNNQQCPSLSWQPRFVMEQHRLGWMHLSKPTAPASKATGSRDAQQSPRAVPAQQQGWLQPLAGAGCPGLAALVAGAVCDAPG